MLYIKFNITDPSKYTDFKKLYEHMLQVRQPNFVIEDEKTPEFDWDNMTDKEVNIAIETLLDYCEQDKIDFKRFQRLIPKYASIYLKSYLKQDCQNLKLLDESDAISILNYLEYGFEVDLNEIENLNTDLCILKFSTGNYPFGGLERILITLRSFDLIPVEFFDGFSVSKLDWISKFEYNIISLPKKTKEYLKNFEN
jgi:hypothetical protein